MKIINNILKMFMFVILLVNTNFAERYLSNSGAKYQDWGLTEVPFGYENLVKWSSSNINWYLHNLGASVEGVSFNDTKNEITAGFSSWDNISTVNINPSYINSTTNTWEIDYQNVFYWAQDGDDAYDYPKPFGYEDVGLIYYAMTIITVDANHILQDVDIIFNGRFFDWKIETSQNYNIYEPDIRAVATHEIGHLLGIGHSELTGLPDGSKPTMSGEGYFGLDERTLEFDDQVAASFSTAGNVIDNKTLSSGRDKFFEKNTTIVNNKTLTVTNATVKFSPNTSLTVNGSLNATNSTFTSLSSTWGGIRFNSGSSGGISYSYIQNADYGIRFNNAGTTSIMVSNSTIQNNTAGGIYFYNTYAKIHDNVIQNNGSLGIRCDNYSSPELVGNTITGHSNYGLICHYYSSAKLAELNVYYSGGYNSITSNSGYGIYADYYSNLYLGSAPYGGYNNIYSNSNYELAALYSCNIAAENNYWGGDTTNAIYRYQSTVDISPYLQSQAQSQLNMMEHSIAEASTTISGSTQTNPELEKAFELYIIGKYEEAMQVYNQIFEKSINEKDRIYALIGLSDCYKTSGKNGFLDFLNSAKSSKSIINNDLLTVALELENRILLEENNFNQVIKNLEAIINNPLSISESKKYALYNSIYIYLNFLNDRNKAGEIFSRLEKEFPDDQLVSDSKFLLTGEQIQNKETILTKNNSTEQSETTVPKSFKLIGNYPNPFNPTTIINYTVPTTSNVKISIYDIAGSLIKSFYSNSLNAGIHSVEWDGTNESGLKVSSGTYIYRMEAVSLEGNAEKFVQSRKMILLK